MTPILELPIPPSTNALYRNVSKAERARAVGKLPGRVMTKEYKAWIAEADGVYLTQKRSVAPHAILTGDWYCVVIHVPCDVALDVDNMSKSVVDYLWRVGLTPDDSRMWSVMVSRHMKIKDGIRVTWWSTVPGIDDGTK